MPTAQKTQMFELVHMHKTSTGLPNCPTTFCQVKNLEKASERLSDASKLSPVPLLVTSGFRSPTVNKAVGGAKNSMHLYLEDSAAIDFTTGSVVDNRAVYLRLKAFGEFDELILEKGGKWIHIGWKNVHATSHAGKAWETNP